MRLYYVDDSGDRSSNPKNPYFTLGGFGIDAGQAIGLKDRIADISDKFGMKLSHPVELKMNNIGRDDSAKKPNWMYRAGLDRETRRALVYACIRELAATPTVKIIAVAVNRPELYSKTTSPIYYAMECLLERIQYDCEEHSAVGIVVCDEERSHDKVLRGQMRAGSLYSNYARLVDTISFMPSTESVGLQMADLVSGAVTRSLNWDDHGFLRIIWPAFRIKFDRVLGYGLKFFPDQSFVPPGPVEIPWPDRERNLCEIECQRLGKSLIWKADGTPLIGLPSDGTT